MCRFNRALDVILDEDLPGRSHELGEYFKSELQKLITQLLKVRGRGLFIGVELHENARPFCEALKEKDYYVKKLMIR